MHLAVQTSGLQILIEFAIEAELSAHNLCKKHKHIPRLDPMRFSAEITDIRACICLVNFKVDPVVTIYFDVEVNFFAHAI